MANNTFAMSYVRRLYAERFPEGHWFDRGSMRFFNTRLPRTAYMDVVGRLWFITSERYDYSHPARYSVRCFDPRAEGRNGVDTIGKFQAYGNRASARHAMREAIKAANPAG